MVKKKVVRKKVAAPAAGEDGDSAPVVKKKVVKVVSFENSYVRFIKLCLTEENCCKEGG